MCTQVFRPHQTDLQPKPTEKVCSSRSRPNQRTRPNYISAKPKQSLLILSDSHGRYLINYINNLGLNSSNFNINCILKPNADLRVVTDSFTGLIKDFNKNDAVLVIAGTNNKILDEEDKLIKDFKALISAAAHTNVLIAGIPTPHIRPIVSESVDYINFELQHMISRIGHASFVPINELPRHMYTTHGLHHNRKGKRLVASMIMESLQNQLESNSTTTSNINMDGEVSQTSPPLSRTNRTTEQPQPTVKTMDSFAGFTTPDINKSMLSLSNIVNRLKLDPTKNTPDVFLKRVGQLAINT